MNHVNVTINARQYRMACEEGQEVLLLKLAESLEARIQSLRGKFGEIGDTRLTVMAALMVSDELAEAARKIRRMEEELAAHQDARVVAVEVRPGGIDVGAIPRVGQPPEVIGQPSTGCRCDLLREFRKTWRHRTFVPH